MFRTNYTATDRINDIRENLHRMKRQEFEEVCHDFVEWFEVEEEPVAEQLALLVQAGSREAAINLMFDSDPHWDGPLERFFLDQDLLDIAEATFDEATSRVLAAINALGIGHDAPAIRQVAEAWVGVQLSRYSERRRECVVHNLTEVVIADIDTIEKGE